MNQWVGLVVFWVASITDLADGWLARRDGLITTFGKIADPIADKLLTGAAWAALSQLELIPWWITIVILIREVGITLLRLSILDRKVVDASRSGKWKTTFQIVTVSLFLLVPFGEFAWATVIQNVSLYLTLALTVFSGVLYLQAMTPILKEKFRGA